jgi:hypothetical protein
MTAAVIRIKQRLLLAPDPRLGKVARDILCDFDNDEVDNGDSSAEQVYTTGRRKALVDVNNEEKRVNFLIKEGEMHSLSRRHILILLRETPKKKTKKTCFLKNGLSRHWCGISQRHFSA